MQVARMNPGIQTIHIFICNTFRDMKAESDALQARARCKDQTASLPLSKPIPSRSTYFDSKIARGLFSDCSDKLFNICFH